MPNPFFERVRRAREATCFQCYGALDDLCASGFEQGNGASQGFCDACRAVTFFDVIEESEEA